MHTVAERQVLVRVAADVELVGVGEHLFVAVARDVGQVDGFALGDLHAAHLGVLLRGAHELLDRHHPADHLLDRRGQQPLWRGALRHGRQHPERHRGRLG